MFYFIIYTVVIKIVLNLPSLPRFKIYHESVPAWPWTGKGGGGLAFILFSIYRHKQVNPNAPPPLLGIEL